METNLSQHKYECSIPDVVTIIEGAPEETPILLDFDETLFLKNSTEEYLNSLQPRILGAILLLFLSFTKPWNWLPGKIRGEISRDWVRVVITTLFFPWTPLLWRWRGKQLAQSYSNERLVHALQKNPSASLIVATQGFDFIVRPIINHLPLPIKEIIACRFWQGAHDRQRGKKTLIIESLDVEVLNHAVCITDSIDDAPLLDAVPHPCLTQWPEAQYRQAMGDLYLPLFYIERVKQPGENYLAKVILADDLFFLILASSWLSPNPAFHAISMTFLMIAFWCIYEIGYMENDRIAEKFEKNPKLSENYQKYKSRINLWQPWIWASLISLPGIITLELSKLNLDQINFSLGFDYFNKESILIDFLLWISVLILVRISFLLYNYVNKPTRVWLYPILQAYKCFGFLILTTTNIIGAMLFVSQVLSRWILYLVYRYAKGGWRKMGQMIRFLLFLLLLFAASLGIHDPSVLFSWQTGLILSYAFLRAFREFAQEFNQMGLIYQDNWESKKP